MKQPSIVKRIILSHFAENKKLFLIKTLCAVLLAFVIYGVNLFFDIYALPTYFISLLGFCLYLNKSKSRFFFWKGPQGVDFYSFALPLSYKEKVVINIAQKLLGNPYTSISLLYLASYIFDDIFNGYSVTERILFYALALAQIPFLYSILPTVNFIDKVAIFKTKGDIRILLINIPSFLLIITLVGANLLLVVTILESIFDNSKAPDFPIFLFVLFFDLMFVRRILIGDKTENEHEITRLIKLNFRDQLFQNLKFIGTLATIHIVILFFVFQISHENESAYGIMRLYHLQESPKALALIKNKDKSEFVSYYKTGMREDSKLEWLNDKFIYKNIIKYDRLEVLKDIISVSESEYDKKVCQVFDYKECPDNSLLIHAIANNSKKILGYLLNNKNYKIDGFDFNDAVVKAAKECNGRSIATIMDSNVISKDTEAIKTEVVDILTYNSTGKCKVAMRDLLKQHLKN